MRVRSAPLRPGASPTKRTRASSDPFSSLKTAVRPHIAGQRRHAAASADSARNFSSLWLIEIRRIQNCVLSDSLRLEGLCFVSRIQDQAQTGSEKPADANATTTPRKQ